MKRLAAAVLIASLALGCSAFRWLTPDRGPKPPVPDTSQGLVELDSGEMASFFEHASGFYARLALRRFNDRTTFLDPKLGAYFRTESAYADYYANLTGALRFAHFKRLRPISVEVVEVRAEGPGKAVVVAKLIGENSRPLSITGVDLVREDRWERVGERWWIVPGPI